MVLRERRPGGRRLACALGVLVAALAAAGCEPGRSDYIKQAGVILQKSLRDDRASVRALAMTAYRELDKKIPEAELNVLLGDPQAPGRFAAMRARAEQLGEGPLQKRREIIYLTKVYREDDDPSVRLAAVYGLALRHDTRHMEALARALNNPRANPGARRNAAMLLGLLGNKSAVPMLKRHLKGAEPGLRLNVAEALARLGSNSGLPAIRALAADAKSRWQVYAILALGRVGIRPKDVRFLREEFGNDRECSLAARLASYGARAMLGDYAQMTTLEEIVMAEHGEGGPLEAKDRAFILQLLARAGYGLAWQEAGACLSVRDEHIRLSAAWATLAFDTPQARQLMRTVDKSSAGKRGVKRMTASEILRQKPKRPGNSGSNRFPAVDPGDPLSRRPAVQPIGPLERRK